MTTDEIICHYGVLGMKWGVRRTPEQLGHKPSGKRVNVEGQAIRYDSPTMRTLRSIPKGVAVQTMAYLIPGFGIAWNAHVANNLLKYNSTKEYDRTHEKLSELHKKPDGATGSINEDVRACNKTGKKGYVKNCFNCVCALEMRQRGYDVIANPRSIGETFDGYKQYFSGLKIQNSSISKKSGQSRKEWVMENYTYLCKSLENNGPNARGFVSFAYENANSGHTVMWATDQSGSVSFYDPQSGSTNATNTMSLSNQDYTWGRLDDRKISNNITEVVTNRKEEKK